MTTAEQFKALRLEREWSATAAAYYLKTTASMIYQIEAGKTTPGGRKLANRIQKLLGIPTTAWDEPEAPTGGEAAK